MGTRRGPRHRRGPPRLRDGVTLIPQFVDRGGSEVTQTFLLAGIFIAMGLVWLTGYALLVAEVGVLLRRQTVRRLVNAVSGAILVALGIRLAFERS